MELLAHERVVSENGSPGRWLYVLHGIYGAGRNWSTVARRLVRERDDWGVILVDLREHGGSRGFPPPHTLAAAADDVRALTESLPNAMNALLGHSFGGKVALSVTALRRPGLEQLWVVDSTPDAGEPSGSAWRMLRLLRRLPAVFPSPAELIGALEAEGMSRLVAQWMATNLEQRDDGYHWRFDLDAIEAMLRDFFRTDLWPVVEQPAVSIHFVKATRSDVLSAEAVARLEQVAEGSAVHLHPIDGGHWLNADNPAALVRLLARELASTADARAGGADPG